MNNNESVPLKARSKLHRSMKKLYFFNNYSGVDAVGLRDSVYLLQQKLDPQATVLEEGDIESQFHPKLRNFDRVKDNCQRCKESACEILKAGDIPILIGGDHSISMGSASATASHFDNIGLVWIDAHGDINTEQTTLSGNVHGMTIASLLGLGNKALTDISGEHSPINPSNIIYLGLRDLDPGESEFIAKLPVKAYPYREIKERGLSTVLEEIKKNCQVEDLHISLDLDSMNPLEMPGVSVPVEGGFSVEEVKKILSFLSLNFQCRAYDFVEYNSFYDKNEMTLKNCLYLIKSIC